MKLLVTGAPGWLGTRLLKILSRNQLPLDSSFLTKEIKEIGCLVQEGIDTKIVEDINLMKKSNSCNAQERQDIVKYLDIP